MTPENRISEVLFLSPPGDCGIPWFRETHQFSGFPESPGEPRVPLVSLNSGFRESSGTSFSQNHAEIRFRSFTRKSGFPESHRTLFAVTRNSGFPDSHGNLRCQGHPELRVPGVTRITPVSLNNLVRRVPGITPNSLFPRSRGIPCSRSHTELRVPEVILNSSFREWLGNPVPQSHP